MGSSEQHTRWEIILWPNSCQMTSMVVLGVYEIQLRARSTLSRRPLCGPLPYSSTQGSQVTPLRVRVLPGLAALGWNVPWGGALWLVPISTPSWQPVLGDKPRYSCSQVETTCFWPVWLPCQSSRHSSGRPLMARQNPLWN